MDCAAVGVAAAWLAGACVAGAWVTGALLGALVGAGVAPPDEHAAIIRAAATMPTAPRRKVISDCLLCGASRLIAVSMPSGQPPRCRKLRHLARRFRRS